MQSHEQEHGYVSTHEKAYNLHCIERGRCDSYLGVSINISLFTYYSLLLPITTLAIILIVGLDDFDHLIIIRICMLDMVRIFRGIWTQMFGIDDRRHA